MGWKDVPDSGGQSEKIPGGQTELRVVKVVRGSKKDGPFTSSKGDPQIMLIFGDREAREAAVMVTLSAKAAWKLKSYLVALGVDLDAMDRDNIDWTHFADEAFANQQLLERNFFRAEVRYDEKGYADVLPLRTPVPTADEIPI